MTGVAPPNVNDDRRRERAAWLALAAVPGVGPHTFARLMAACGTAAEVLAAARDGTLRRRLAADISGRALGSKLVAGIAAAAVDPDFVAQLVTAHDVWVLTPLDADYPSRFDVLPAPPPVIYGWGSPSSLTTARSVAIVGTRRPTPTGRSLAGRVARTCVELGATVVSGLAFGIDGVAHATAVESGGLTVAVIAGGHAEPGPRAHRRLVEDIVRSGGAVVSEMAPNVVPERGSFPRRNRLIAALGDATVIIEAPTRSGAINTAHHALELGRPLFVAPGRPGDPSVAGCLRLLRETPAAVVGGLPELVDDLAHVFAARPGPVDAPLDAVGVVPVEADIVLASLGPVARSVADAVARQPATLDDLVDLTGLAPGELAGAVSLLHLRGLVRILGATIVAGETLSRDR